MSLGCSMHLGIGVTPDPDTGAIQKRKRLSRQRRYQCEDHAGPLGLQGYGCLVSFGFQT